MKKTKLASLLIVGSLALSLFNGIGTATKVDAATPSPTTGKNVVAYMPNWATYSENMRNMNPAQIPWDKVTVVNHAFFTVDTNFQIATTDGWADFEKPFDHSGPGSEEKGYFGEYKYFKEKYPDKKIMVSVGGWTRGENFHAMSANAKTRAIFINSVIDFYKKYPFIDGIDIDWEYPGVDREKDPSDWNDHGCPGGPEDTHNYTLLLKELRQAYNANAMPEKMLTIAAPAGEEKIKLTEPDKYAKYLDFINVMTYDIHGSWDSFTNHQTALYANPADPSPTSPIDVKNKYTVTGALKVFTDTFHVPKSKINVGTPFSSQGWSGVQPGPNGDGLYQSATGGYSLPNDQNNWFALKKLETTPGWTKHYDSVAHAVSLYNPTLQAFLSYEDENTLTEKADYVNNNGFGGMMLWDITGDDSTNGFPMVSIMHDKINPNDHGIIAWAPNTSYKTGSYIAYNGKYYKCIQGHTSQTGWEPTNVPALWKQL